MNIMLIVQMIVFALLAIGILVTVHEYGHYIVAKKLGIKVLRFSVGFGKPVWSKRAGSDQTEYVISRWPLGGYVKMLDERDCEVAPEEQHRAFNRQPISHRILVLVAGPAFNFLLAVLFFWLVFVIGVNGVAPVLGSVTVDSPAARAGLEAEQKIVSVNGKNVATWSEAHLALLDAVIENDSVALEVQHFSGGRTYKRVLDNIGDRKALTAPEALMPGLGLTVWRPPSPPVISMVEPGLPAERAGLLPDDVVTGIDGRPVESFDDVISVISDLANQTVPITVMRGQSSVSFNVSLQSMERDGVTVGRLGAGFKPSAEAQAQWESLLAKTQYGPVQALGRAGEETWNMSVMMLSMLGKMAIGQVSVRNISGPLNIARFAGYSARQGPAYYIRFLALLSLSLGVLNLLPIPMLDGGQVVYQLAEAVKGSPLSMRTEMVGQQIGITLLFILMFFAFRNDIISIFG
ncbi:MAG: RIP metalloprotease RseP [Gammaproteobacteria bacterium]|nr:RIP metalloprotease RseP [Gammaproteobacteria bacterium]